MVYWGMLFVGLDLGLLTYSTSFDIVFNPFLHANPPVVLLDSSECLISSWVPSCGGVMCFAYYGPF